MPATCFVILHHRVPGDVMNEEIMNRHLEYLSYLHEEGKLMLSGALRDQPSSMMVVYAADKAEAVSIAELDPFVLQGRQKFDVRTWDLLQLEEFASAGLVTRRDAASQVFQFA